MKIVMVVNKELPVGLIANTTAVLGISLGKMVQDIVGCDVNDAAGNTHLGITTKTIPILGGDREQLKRIRDCCFAPGYADITTIGFSEVAQKCLDYDSYSSYLSLLGAADIYYLGICLYGPVKKINKLTGSLGLLR